VSFQEEKKKREKEREGGEKKLNHRFVVRVVVLRLVRPI
jgi:hypothetical protein